MRANRGWRKRFEGDPTEVTIPQDEQQEKDQTQQEQEQVQEQKPVLTTETYQEMLNNLKQVSGEVRKSVVEIQGAVTEEKFSKDQEDKEKSISGMIVADNGQELLILAGGASGKRREDHPCYIFRRQSVRCHFEEPGCRAGTVCLCSSEKEYCG